MTEKIKFLMADGSFMAFDKYQKQNDLTGEQIGKYFKYTETKFMKDLEEFGKLIVCQKLMHFLDVYREIKGEPVKINSFNRNAEKQAELREQGLRAAKVSPHQYYLAADCDTISREDTMKNVKHVKEAIRITGLKVRYGYNQYLEAGQTFIHIDVCPEFFSKGKPWHLQPHPTKWEYQITW